MDIKKLSRKRKLAGWLLAGLEFVCSLSAALVLADLAQTMGLPILIGLTLSASTFLFFGVLAIALLGGIICALKVMYDSRKKLKEEIKLTHECDALEKKQQLKLNRLKTMLQSLYRNDSNRDDIIDTKINSVMNKGKASQNPPTKPVPFIKKFGEIIWTNSIAFFSGIGSTLGIAMSILGVAGLPVLLSNPIGWGILAGVLVAALTVGVLMAYAAHRVIAPQEKQLAELSDKKFQLTLTNKRLDKQMIKIPLLLHSASLTPSPSAENKKSRVSKHEIELFSQSEDSDGEKISYDRTRSSSLSR